MDIFFRTFLDIYANGFPPNWTVLKVATEEAPWVDTVFIGHFSKNCSLGRVGLSKAVPLRQQAAVLRGAQPYRHPPQSKQCYGPVHEREQPD